MRRFETEKPIRPALGLAPRPVAPSSRISPPEPVAAPGNGEMAVGWLCVSHLHQDVRGLALVAGTTARRPGRSAPPAAPSHDRGVVRVGEHGALRAGRVRVADHLEQRLVLLLAVDDPVGVEDLVAAVLAVGLREHHQLDVGRVAAERAVGLAPGSRSRRRRAPGPAAVGLAQRARPRTRLPSGRGAHVLEQPLGRLERARARPRSCGRAAARRQRRVSGACRRREVGDAALDAPHAVRGRSCARCRSPSTTRARWCRGAAPPGTARRRAGSARGP